jgi:hypothetical protein
MGFERGMGMNGGWWFRYRAACSDGRRRDARIRRWWVGYVRWWWWLPSADDVAERDDEMEMLPFPTADYVLMIKTWRSEDF